MLHLACGIGLGSHQVGDQLFVARRIFARHDHRFLHVRLLAQDAFNLAQLDAEAPNLDLLVNAPQKLNAMP